MCFKQSVILLLVATNYLTISAESFLDDNTNFSLLSLMARSNDVMQRNPLRSTECFNYYIPLIDEIAKTYQKSHDTCLQSARDGHSAAEVATLDKRNALAASASSSCELLSNCSEISSAEKVFECYAAGGSASVKTMHELNVNAAEHLSDLQEEFRLIENREYKCTNETKRQYEKDASKAYEDFNKCILGIIDVPNPTEAPASTANPEQSTQAPVEPDTTEVPEVPETTPNPEESTQASETTNGPDEANGSGEVNPESKLPEEDLSFLQWIKNYFKQR